MTTSLWVAVRTAKIPFDSATTQVAGGSGFGRGPSQGSRLVAVTPAGGGWPTTSTSVGISVRVSTRPLSRRPRPPSQASGSLQM